MKWLPMTCSAATSMCQNCQKQECNEFRCSRRAGTKSGNGGQVYNLAPKVNKIISNQRLGNYAMCTDLYSFLTNKVEAA